MGGEGGGGGPPGRDHIYIYRIYHKHHLNKYIYIYTFPIYIHTYIHTSVHACMQTHICIYK